jgi:tripartite-type tricarboxylate transporter receptor subunit TctC
MSPLRSMARTICTLLFAALLPLLAQAQAYPNRPVRIVVPYAPGGVPDVVIRLVGQRLSEMWKQPVVVDNRPGANGNLGTQHVARSAPDGYTLLLGNSSTHGTNAALYTNLGFDPVNDFEPISGISQNTLILGVPAVLPIHSVKELIAYAKARPEKLNYGSYGIASSPHLMGALLKDRTGIDMVHVPYKGAVAALSALINNEVQMVFDSALIVQYAKNGTVRLIGVASAQRWPGLPDVPTFAEQGLPDLKFTGWLALFAPKGTPRPVIEKISADVNTVLAMPEMKQRIQDMLMITYGTKPEELGRLVRAELDRGRELVRLSGAQPE